MISVAQAEKIIFDNLPVTGSESLSLLASIGRTLAEDLCADRDMPPYDRVTMDGIAIRYEEYEAGIREFKITGIQAAGEEPITSLQSGSCIEIMTGAAMPECFDTIVRYEDLQTMNGIATIVGTNIKKQHNVHGRAMDKKQGDLLIASGTQITPTVAGIAASIGKSALLVSKIPKVAILSTGDELVPIHETPGPYQVRRSNAVMLAAALQQYHIHASIMHINDDRDQIKHTLKDCLSDYDVLLLSGGISMGKFDHIPHILSDLGVDCLFHKVNQRPGKPFWFGRHPIGAVVFAFPGNPVSTWLCMVRYALPWLSQTLGYSTPPLRARLARDVSFMPAMQFFQQVHLAHDETGQLIATPVSGNGSGDFAHLAHANAFLELPADEAIFPAGSCYPVWPFWGTSF